MQIKQFYLDLREWPQYAKNNNNVWLLESEAFKEPLKFEFTFDSEDQKSLKCIEQNCKDYYQSMIGREQKWNAILESLLDKEKLITNSYQKLEEISKKYDLLLEQIKEKENLIKEKELKENIKIEEINKKVNQISTEINLPEPQKIYNHEWDEFIAWTEVYYGQWINLPSGDYYIIEQYEYEPQNEYVANQDEIKIKTKNIDDRYSPEFQLYSTNSMDKPVSKVKLTVLFFQR